MPGAGQLGQFLLGDRRADLDPAGGRVRQQRGAQEVRPVLAAVVAVRGEKSYGLVAQRQCLLGTGVSRVDDRELQAGPRLAVGDADALEVGAGVDQQLAGEPGVAQRTRLGGALVAGHAR